VTISVQGVVARGKGEPVELTTVLVPEPGPGEALVTVQACGVCHTDLHYKQGGIGDDFPYLLGHEAAGVVDAVGPDVTDVSPGDFVILNLAARCAAAAAPCSRGRPWYCFNTHNATQKMTLEDGTELSPALGIGAFVERRWSRPAVHQSQPGHPGGHGRPARLRRDGGIGAAINTGGVTHGDIGRGDRLRRRGRRRPSPAPTCRAHTIIAVDVDDRKLSGPAVSAPPT